MGKTPAGLASPTLPHPGPLGLKGERDPCPVHAKSQHRGSADEELCTLCFSLPPAFSPHITGCSFCLLFALLPPQEEGGGSRLRQSRPAPGCPPRSVNVSVNVQLPFSIKRLKRVSVSITVGKGHLAVTAVPPGAAEENCTASRRSAPTHRPAPRTRRSPTATGGRVELSGTPAALLLCRHCAPPLAAAVKGDRRWAHRAARSFTRHHRCGRPRSAGPF